MASYANFLPPSIDDYFRIVDPKGKLSPPERIHKMNDVLDNLPRSFPNLIIRYLEILRNVLGSYGIHGTSFTIFLSAYSFLTLRHIQTRAEKLSLLLGIISIVFGILNVFGLMMFHMDALPFFRSGFWGLLTLFLVCGWAILFYFTAHWVLFGFEYIYADSSLSISPSKAPFSWFSHHIWAFSFLFILLCWLPWMIIYYPGALMPSMHSKIPSLQHCSARILPV